MACNRCLRRVSKRISDMNNGYCDNCVVTIGREVVNNVNFTFEASDQAWRDSARHTLSDLYKSLKRAGMRNPFEGMSPGIISLYNVLNIKVD